MYVVVEKNDLGSALSLYGAGGLRRRLGEAHNGRTNQWGIGFQSTDIVESHVQ